MSQIPPLVAWLGSVRGDLARAASGELAHHCRPASATGPQGGACGELAMAMARVVHARRPSLRLSLPATQRHTRLLVWDAEARDAAIVDVPPGTYERYARDTGWTLVCTQVADRDVVITPVPWTADMDRREALWSERGPAFLDMIHRPVGDSLARIADPVTGCPDLAGLVEGEQDRGEDRLGQMDWYEGDLPIDLFRMEFQYGPRADLAARRTIERRILDGVSRYGGWDRYLQAFPVIATLEDGRLAMEDGWHRTKLARDAGRTHVRACVGVQRPATVDNPGEPTGVAGRRLGRALVDLLGSPEGQRLLGHWPSWTAGGCWTMAQAMIVWFGPPATKYVVEGDGVLQHIVVQIGDWYFDGDGASTADELVRRWVDVEGFEDAELVPWNKYKHEEEVTEGEVRCPIRKVEAMERLLARRLGRPGDWSGREPRRPAGPRTVIRASVQHATSADIPEHLPLKLGRSKSASSYEGVGLSVGMHPEVWNRIARLGARWAYVLDRRDGRPGHFAIWSPSLSRRALAWAEGDGLVRRLAAWRVLYLDRETDEERSMTFATRQDAEREAGDLTRARVEEHLEYWPEPKLAARWEAYFAAPMREPWQAEVESVNLYIATMHPDLDGVWWDERLDPDALSAPRGVLLPHALGRWVVAGRRWIGGRGEG